MKHYGNTQLRFALIYVLITFLVLLFLNFYCAQTSQRIIYENKQTSMLERCENAAGMLKQIESENVSAIAQTVARLDTSRITRMMVTDSEGYILYDSLQGGAADHLPSPEPEIRDALRCQDVFSWDFHDGRICSRAAVPIVDYSDILGCVYILEEDYSQGNLIRSLQYNVFTVTVALELLVIIFAFGFSRIFSRRLRRIMSSIRLIQSGDYSHKVEMGGRDELTALGDEFNDLTDKLQTSESKRSQFVSDASHELKTPLASIKLLTDSILQNPMDTGTVKEFVTDIGSEVDRLTRMTQKLLTLAKVESQPEENWEIITMAPTIHRVVRMLEGLAREENITICVDDRQDSPVLLLEDDFYQIVFNLVENGIKYNVTGGRLDITLLRQDDNAVMQICDTGVGISEDALCHIFERFYRVDKARSRKTGGTGLGLAIVRNLIERNSGKIQVSSTPGKGTCFQVIFPVFDMDSLSQ